MEVLFSAPASYSAAQNLDEEGVDVMKKVVSTWPLSTAYTQS